MTTTTTTTTMRPHPPERPEYEWLLAYWLTRDASRATWDGLYQAPCPCGQLVWWSAYLTYPHCDCPIHHTTRPQSLDDDLDP